MTDKGKFTRMFDREFIESDKERTKQAQKDSKELEHIEVNKKQQKVNSVINKVKECINKRREFLISRFPNMKDISTEFSHVAFRFEKGDKFACDADVIFDCKLSDAGEGLFVESFIQVKEKNEKKSDYISFGINKFDESKVSKFVEDKLMEFAQIYLPLSRKS